MVYRILRDQWFLDWFAEWAGGFDWDLGNSQKPVKHGLSIADIEEFFSRTTVVHGRIEEPFNANWTEERFLLTQRSPHVGKCFSIIATVRADHLRIVTCRRSWPEEEARHDSNS